MTELGDFVTSVLTEIAQGVANANGVISSLGGNLNPAVGGTVPVFDPETQRRVVDVVFDVSVEATSGQGNTGKVGVLVASIGLGTERRSETTDKAIHKIQFSVPMVLPIHGEQLASEQAAERDRRDKHARPLGYRSYNPLEP